MEGNRWFRSSYFQKRFFLDAGPPLNVNALQRRLQLLLEDSRIQRLNAELKPGLRRGEGILDVRVEERTPYRLLLEYNNYQSPSVGENRGLVTLWYENVTGNGDVFFGQYGRSKGLNPLLDFKYAIPVNAYDTTLSYEYRKNTLAVIEQPFQGLDVNSKSDIYTYTVRQPVYRTLNSDFALELIAERLWLQTTLLGGSRSPWSRGRSTADRSSSLCARLKNLSIARSTKLSLRVRAFLSGWTRSERRLTKMVCRTGFSSPG